MAPLAAPISYFPDYESLDAAFRRRVAGLTPRTHAGARCFWDDFRRLWEAADAGAPGAEEACITPNPRHCLAFGNPWQELQAALLTGGVSAGDPYGTPEALAAAYGLAGQLRQPMRSLSGGEAVKLALARSHALAGGCRRLTMASPFSWLAAANRPLVERLLAHYHALQRPLEILALEGEDDPDPPSGTMGDLEPLAFRLGIAGGRITLGTPLDGWRAPPVRAAVADVETPLASPCLFTGANGAGKSLTAKALAGAVPRRGAWGIGRGAAPPRPRLLLQDVLAQALMRPLARLERGPGAAGELYRRILEDHRESTGTAAHTPPAPDRFQPPSLVALKAMLAAARLAQRPGTLILDEPDWGLSRPAALAYVGAVCRAAHGLQVPVVIISHKPWWDRMAASRLAVAKGPAGEGAAFTIALTAGGGAA